MKSVTDRRSKSDIEFEIMHSIYNAELKAKKQARFYSLCASVFLGINILLFLLFAQLF